MRPLPDRFWAKVDKAGPTPEHRPDLGPCWLWTANRFTDGYGQIKMDGRPQRAHRLPFEEVNGPIPEGLVPDHLCFVRSCVNPGHLELVTVAENNRRRSARIQACLRGHPYDEENTYRRPGGRRNCRRCHRDRMAARRGV